MFVKRKPSRIPPGRKDRQIYVPHKQMQIVQDNVGQSVAMYMKHIRPWSRPLQFAISSSARIVKNS